MLLSLMPATTTLDKPATGNSVHVIFPYLFQGQWVFDDDRFALSREPFVCGAEAWIGQLAAAAGLQPAEYSGGFKLIFSATALPGFHQHCTRINDPALLVGAMYRDQDGIPGWLCPALLHYFAKPPDEIFAQAERRVSAV